MLASPAVALLATIVLLSVYHLVVALLEGPPKTREPGVGLAAYIVVVDLLVPAALAITLMSQVVPDPLAKVDVFERADRLVSAGLPEAAATELRKWLEKSPGDVRAHRYYLWAHFRAPVLRAKQARND